MAFHEHVIPFQNTENSVGTNMLSTKNVTDQLFLDNEYMDPLGAQNPLQDTRTLLYEARGRLTEGEAQSSPEISSAAASRSSPVDSRRPSVGPASERTTHNEVGQEQKQPTEALTPKPGQPEARTEVGREVKRTEWPASFHRDMMIFYVIAQDPMTQTLKTSPPLLTRINIEPQVRVIPTQIM